MFDFLALDGAIQREIVGSCPGCSTRSEKVMPLYEQLEGCSGHQAGGFRDVLRRIWALCNELPEETLGYFDFGIYTHPGWQAIRRETREALRQNGWGSIRNHAEGLRDDCWERVYGYPKKWKDRPSGWLSVALRRTAYSPLFALNSRRR